MRELQLFLLIGLANGAPILAENVLRGRFGHPIDGGMRFIDGRPLLGRSKTVRGLVAAVLAATVCGWLLGPSASVGLWIGFGAMAGDLLSSFLKRRLAIPSSGMALGLDQIPEVVLPLALVRESLALEWATILELALLFFAFELLISRVLFRLRIRKRPY